MVIKDNNYSPGELMKRFSFFVASTIIATMATQLIMAVPQPKSPKTPPRNPLLIEPIEQPSPQKLIAAIQLQTIAGRNPTLLTLNEGLLNKARSPKRQRPSQAPLATKADKAPATNHATPPLVQASEQKSQAEDMFMNNVASAHKINIPAQFIPNQFKRASFKSATRFVIQDSKLVDVTDNAFDRLNNNTPEQIQQRVEKHLAYQAPIVEREQQEISRNAAAAVASMKKTNKIIGDNAPSKSILPEAYRK